MPPQQCPSCGRFLKNAFVAALQDAPAACPGCGDELRPELFDAGTGAAATPDVASEAPTPAGASAASPASDAGSVRPPDVAPETVRDDVLAGWDAGVGVDTGAGLDRPPAPVDALVVGGAALAGAVLGLVVDRRRVRGAALGAVLGAVAAGVARRIWQLED